MVQQITRCRNIKKVYVNFKKFDIDGNIYEFIAKIDSKNQQIRIDTLKTFKDEYKKINKDNDDDYKKFNTHYDSLYNEYFEDVCDKWDKLKSLLKKKGF